MESTKKRAKEEKEILDELSAKEELSKIELRALKHSMQTMIENLIGKSKKILKHYGSPVIPMHAKDAVRFLYEVGMISEEQYKTFSSAVGLRNVLIHDYMNFDDAILIKLLKEKRYMDIYLFLIEEPNPSDVIIKRIENFSI